MQRQRHKESSPRRGKKTIKQGTTTTATPLDSRLRGNDGLGWMTDWLSGRNIKTTTAQRHNE
jgi:hypothetical protein